jgi:retron-type reverse transcriptase
MGTCAAMAYDRRQGPSVVVRSSPDLLHHIYAVERLRAAYRACKRDAAAGVDGQTWASYGQALARELLDCRDRLARGGYRPQPVKRVYIDKTDGSKRPLGVPALEDKIVQRATVEVLNAIYEQDFLGFSYGFRPGKSAHNALDAVAMGVWSQAGELDTRCGHQQVLRHDRTRLADQVHRAPGG